jgi:uncharacterized membrane protein
VDANTLITWAADFLAYIGVLIIFLGGVVAVVETLLHQLYRSKVRTISHIRGQFAQRIIFGLDFMIASDIIVTLVAPNLEEVARLGGIVLIRTVLTYVLSKERAELLKEEKEELSETSTL